MIGRECLGGRRKILKEAGVLVVDLEERSVHYFNGRKVDRLTVAPLINDR